MDLIKGESIQALANPGVISRQLLNQENSSSERVAITEVHVEPGAGQPRHIHEASEQIWYALKGRGRLLLADEIEQEFRAGDVARFAAGDVHGLRNDGEEAFAYIAVTAPPVDFQYAYREKR